jgi:hypothetical protein
MGIQQSGSYTLLACGSSDTSSVVVVVVVQVLPGNYYYYKPCYLVVVASTGNVLVTDNITLKIMYMYLH